MEEALNRAAACLVAARAARGCPCTLATPRAHRHSVAPAPAAVQIITFLRRDAERKDELIESMKGTIKQQRNLFAEQRAQEVAEQEAAMAATEGELRSSLEVTMRRAEVAEAELAQLVHYKDNKAKYDANMVAKDQALLDEQDANKEAMTVMERKFFEEKARLQKEYKQMLAEMKKASQEEAVERLDASTKKILFENRRMAEELRLQIRETDELQKVNKATEEDNRRLKREVALNDQAVKEYAKQGHRQAKEISDLLTKVKSLERFVSSSTREFEKEKGSLLASGRKMTSEAETDAAGLRQLVKLRTKELTNVKRLAALVLQKRNEVETFLLESIEQVKVEIGRRRAEEERTMSRSGGGQTRFPSLTGGVQRASNLPQTVDERVDIRDLTWEDRERVLRLLFAKINSASGHHGVAANALHVRRHSIHPASLPHQRLFSPEACLPLHSVTGFGHHAHPRHHADADMSQSSLRQPQEMSEEGYVDESGQSIPASAFFVTQPAYA